MQYKELTRCVIVQCKVDIKIVKAGFEKLIRSHWRVKVFVPKKTLNIHAGIQNRVF